MRRRAVAVIAVTALLLAAIPAHGASPADEDYEWVVLHEDTMEDFAGWEAYVGDEGDAEWSIDSEVYSSAPSSALLTYSNGGTGGLEKREPVDLSRAVDAKVSVWVEAQLYADDYVGLSSGEEELWQLSDEWSGEVVELELTSMCGSDSVHISFDLVSEYWESEGHVRLDDIQVLALLPVGDGGTNPPPGDGAYDPGLPTASTPVKRVSIGLGGAEPDRMSVDPSVSADGRYVAFASDASNLVAGDANDGRDVFVRDLETGVTELVSVADDGSGANGESEQPSISADGRYVAFWSYASNLVPNDTNDQQDVFVRDRQAGTTTRVSVTSSGAEARDEAGDFGFMYWCEPQISADGRRVAFISRFTNLVPDDTNGEDDVFVHDRTTGQTTRVSSNGGKSPRISPDGRYVAFEAGYHDAWLYDHQSGTAEQLVVEGTYENDCVITAFSHDNRVLGLYTPAHSVKYEGSYAYGYNAALYDRQAKDLALLTTFHQTEDGKVWARSGYPCLSHDGSRAAFSSSPLESGVTGDQVYVTDIVTGTTQLASASANGTAGNEDSDTSALSGNGRYVAFFSSASNLVEGDTNGVGDVFISYVGSADDGPDPSFGVSIAGTSRYDTAVAASKHAYPDGLDPAGARTVVLATGRNWPDALGGTALAGALDGPILLTETNTVPDVVMTEIARLNATKAIVLGGPDVVGPAVISALSSKLGAPNVERIAGTSRYETANKVAKRVIATLGDSYDGTAFIATGAKFPDALAAAPLAAAKGWPLLLAHPTSGLSDATKTEMAGTKTALILGGTDVVSPATETYLKTTFGDAGVTRLAGTSRYDTAVKVAEHGVASAGLGWDKVGITTGQKFPDALAGGVVQAKASSVMLLTRTDILETATRDALSDNKAAITTVTFFGGDSAVSAAVRTEVAQALQ